MDARRVLVAFLSFAILIAPSGRQLEAQAGTPAPHVSAPVWDVKVVAEYPHDADAYTQGLDIDHGELFEGTGQYGRSSLRRVDLESGEVLQSRGVPPEYFGEGNQVVGDRIFQLTWKEHTCFVYDRQTLEVIETFSYDTQGWGLTYDGALLIMSDGSSRLTFRDPQTFETVRTVDVTYGGGDVVALNELEYIDGEIWANIYMTDFVVRIDPASGEVTGWIDLSGLLTDAEQAELGPGEVLNGIARDPETGRIFVTGKMWPKMFEIELVTSGGR